MKRRCLNPTEREKSIYAGITLYEEWKDYEPFMRWALKNGYSDSLTIDRIDSSKGYYPSNCRFVCYSTQAANRKLTDKNTSGYSGVYPQGDRWIAKVQWHGKQYHIGRFVRKEDAARARDKMVADNGCPHPMNFPQ